MRYAFLGLGILGVLASVAMVIAAMNGKQLFGYREDIGAVIGVLVGFGSLVLIIITKVFTGHGR